MGADRARRFKRGVLEPSNAPIQYALILAKTPAKRSLVFSAKIFAAIYQSPDREAVWRLLGPTLPKDTFSHRLLPAWCTHIKRRSVCKPYWQKAVLATIYTPRSQCPSGRTCGATQVSPRQHPYMGLRSAAPAPAFTPSSPFWTNLESRKQCD